MQIQKVISISALHLIIEPQFMIRFSACMFALLEVEGP